MRASSGPVPARRLAGLAGLAVLGIAAIPLAAPGAALVPGAGADAPGWVLGPFGDGLGVGARGYLALLWLAFAAYLVVVGLAGTIGRRTIVAAVAVLIGAFVLAPPLLSLDVFSYISYARLGVEHGLNPYESVPAAIPDDPAASRVDDWRFAVSVYGPAFTLLTYPLGALGVAESLWSLKALAGLSVAALAAVAARIALRRGVEPLGAAALVALNPLVLVHVVGGAHNDGLMALTMMGGIAVVLAGAEAAGGGLIALGAAVKATGAMVAPFAIVGAARRGRAVAGMLAVAALVLAVTLIAFGSGAGEALGIVGDNQALSSRWSVPSTVARILGVAEEPVRIAFAAAYLAALGLLLAWTIRGADWVRAAGWAMLGLLVASAWLVPWYVVWALPLAAVSRDRALIAAVLALSAFQLVNGVPL
jgi:hypothetical protein